MQWSRIRTSPQFDLAVGLILISIGIYCFYLPPPYIWILIGFVCFIAGLFFIWTFSKSYSRETLYVHSSDGTEYSIMIPSDTTYLKLQRSESVFELWIRDNASFKRISTSSDSAAIDRKMQYLIESAGKRPIHIRSDIFSEVQLFDSLGREVTSE